MPNILQALDKRLVRASFDKAAAQYDEVAVLQREVGARILERLELIKINPQRILDVGCGTGILSQALHKRYKKAHLISLDIAPRMLITARKRTTWLQKHLGRQGFICGDAEGLPVADNSVDMIISSLTLQWCGELEQVFAEFRRALKPDGLLMFTTFGPDTLKELRRSWQIADTDAGVSTHVNDFIDMHDIGDALLRAGLADPVMDVENFTLTYGDAYQLMRELKSLGAHNVTRQRRHSLTGKKRLQAMVEAYEQFRHNGRLPASYEVVYGHAWSTVNKNADVVIPLDTLQRHRE